MISVSELKDGLTIYLEQEMVSKLVGWRKLAFGALASLALDKGVEKFDELKENPFIKMFGIVDENNMIDDETVFSYLYKESSKGSVSFAIPIVGNVTLTARDIKTLQSIFETM